jgi:hypothetical protein
MLSGLLGTIQIYFCVVVVACRVSFPDLHEDIFVQFSEQV